MVTSQVWVGWATKWGSLASGRKELKASHRRVKAGLFREREIAKNLPAMWEIWVQSLGREDPLEKGVAIHYCILACRIPWTEEPGGPQSIESQSAEHDWSGSAFTQHRQGVGCVKSREQPRGVWTVRFYGLDKFTGWRVGGIVQLPWRRDWDFQELGLCLLFWPQELSYCGWVCHLDLMYYREHVLRLKIHWSWIFHSLGSGSFYIVEPINLCAGLPVYIISYSFFFLWWILSYIEMKQPRVYMCSPSQSPLPPPSPPIPSRFSQCTRPEHLSHASNLGWWSVSP